MEYNPNFSLHAAYRFLKEIGLEEEMNDIRQSPDSYKSYTSTLRRAKIIDLLKKENILDNFIKEAWPFGNTKKGFSRIRFFENLYQNFINEQDGIASTEDDEEDLSLEETQFAYESDLRDYLANNLHLIEKGLKLYRLDDEISGIEYPIPNTRRRVDILAIDINNNYVIIELKASRGHEKTIGQVLYYRSMLRKSFDAEKVRIIIVAREISQELKIGTADLSNFQLFEYQLSMTLNKVNPEL